MELETLPAFAMVANAVNDNNEPTAATIFTLAVILILYLMLYWMLLYWMLYVVRWMLLYCVMTE